MTYKQLYSRVAKLAGVALGAAVLAYGTALIFMFAVLNNPCCPVLLRAVQQQL